jgi:glycosyltransferase 2 family protein
MCGISPHKHAGLPADDSALAIKPATRRYAIAAAKAVLFAAVVWAGHKTIVNAISDLQGHGWNLDQLQLAWAAVAAALYLLSQICSGWFWQQVLIELGARVGLLRAMRAYFIGHLGKYVPGKALVVVLRAALVGQPQVRTSMAVVAVFYETFTTMACGAALSCVYLLLFHRERPWLVAGAFAGALVVGIPTLPFVFRRLLHFMQITRAESNLVVAAEVAAATHHSPAVQLCVRTALKGWAAISVGWVLAGGSLWAVLRAVGVDGASLNDLPLYTATVALAVVLGFVSMIPAGLGVRDIALLELLAPHLERLMPGQGELMAVVAVVVLRLVWLAAEVIISTILYPLGRRLEAK